jgi:hypothetical protein
MSKRGKSIYFSYDELVMLERCVDHVEAGDYLEPLYGEKEITEQDKKDYETLLKLSKKLFKAIHETK